MAIITDNQHIYFDHLPGMPSISWDDENEILYVFRSCTETWQNMYPFSVEITDYEMIQFIEIFLDLPDAKKWIDEHKNTFSKNDQEIIDNFYKENVVKRARASGNVSIGQHYGAPRDEYNPGDSVTIRKL